jgi:sortase A
VRDEETIDDARAFATEHGAGLATFYDRRAAAALAYCSRLCAPDAIAEAVEASFARVFEAAAAGRASDDQALDRLLRSAVRNESASRASAATAGMPARRLLERLADPNRGGACELMPALLAARADGALSDGDVDRMQQHLRRCADCRTAEHRFDEAERAFDALAGEDAPALGRSLLAEMLTEAPLEADWLEEIEWDEAPAPRVVQVPADALEEVEVEVEEAEAEAEAEPDAEAPPPVSLPRSPRSVPRDPAVVSADTVDFPAVTRGRMRVASLLHLGARGRRRLAIALLVIGLLLFAEAGLTLLWKEPITAFMTARTQDGLSDQLEKLAASQAIAGADKERIDSIEGLDARTKARMELLARRERESVPTGDALGTLQIGKIGVDRVLVKGTDSATLRKGPGFYDQSSFLPGEGRAVGIAGHRTTYDAPFRKIDELERGDRITLKMPYGLFTYEVAGHRIVPADFKDAFARRDDEELVLSACHPLYSASERILVYARLVSARPLGAAAVDEPAPEEDADADALAQQRKEKRLERMGDRLLTEGMTGPDVKEVQRLLGLPQSGTFGPETTAAVIEFQRTHGLPTVGRVGDQTKAALARREHPPSRPPTPPAVPPQETEQNGTGTTTTPGAAVPPAGQETTTPSG